MREGRWLVAALAWIFAAGCTDDFDALFGQASDAGDDGSSGSAAGGTGGASGSGGASGASGMGGASGASGSGGSFDATSEEAESDAPATSYVEEVMKDNPIAYWRLGESTGATTAQSATGVHHATFGGTPAFARPGAIAGDSDTAIAFEGPDDAARVADVDASAFEFSNDAQFSVELWVSFTGNGCGTSANQFHLVEKFDAVTATKGGWKIYVSDCANPDAGENRFVVFMMVELGGAVSSYVRTPSMDREFHHVLAVYDGQTPKIYLDGKADTKLAGDPKKVTLSASTVPLSIGNNKGGATFAGSVLDEIAIYPYALDQTRLLKHVEWAK